MADRSRSSKALLGGFTAAAGSLGFPSSRYRKIVTPLVLALLWEILPLLGMVPRIFLPPLHEVLARLLDATVVSEVGTAALISLRRALTGFIIAIAAAIPLGVMIGWKRIFYDYTEAVIDLLRTTPSVALIPVFLLFLGPSESTVLAIIIWGQFFFQLIATMYGTQQINETLISSMKTMNISERRLFREVFLPGSMPGIFTGLRQNASLMLVLTIVAEMLVANDGLGQFVLLAQREFRTAEMYVGLLVIMVIGYALNQVFLKVQNRIMFWSERQTIS